MNLVGRSTRRWGTFKRITASVVIASASVGASLMLTPVTAQATSAACVKTNKPADPPYQAWKQVNCHTWHSSISLAGNAYLGVGAEYVVCQRNIGIPNPAYGGHHNTWWVWTLGDRHGSYSSNWGWFPETAFVEGGENVPIGNVPYC